MTDHVSTEGLELRTAWSGKLRSLIAFLLKAVVGKNQASEATTQRRVTEIKDFAAGSVALFFQRQAMYFGAGLLAGFYYDVKQAAICFALCQCTEVLDLAVALRVLRWSGVGRRKVAVFRALMYTTSLFSSLAVAYFSYSLARMEGATVHFAPLFFLFAAGLFAAVNNRQFPQVLGRVAKVVEI